MKIALVTNKVSSIGGVETFTRDIFNILKERRHKVDIISAESLSSAPKEDLEKAIGNHFNNLNRTRNYDVVLCNGEFGYFVEHPRAINVFHGKYFGYAKAVEGLADDSVVQERLKKVKSQVISANGKYVVTISDFNKRELENLGIKVNKVINHSVDTNLFYPKELDILEHALSISRGMYYEKGLDVLKMLAGQGIKIRLFSDRGIDSENIESRGLEDNEAMACGCPVITTKTGYGFNIKEHISYFVAENVAEFLAKFLLITNEREKYSKLALNYFNTFHNPEDFKKEWLHLIENI